jgi:hypothetical protein
MTSIQKIYNEILRMGSEAQKDLLALLTLNQRKSSDEDWSDIRLLYELLSDEFMKVRGIQLRKWSTVQRKRYYRDLLQEAVGWLIFDRQGSANSNRKTKQELFRMAAEAVVTERREVPSTDEDYGYLLKDIAHCVDLSYPGYRPCGLLQTIAQSRLNGTLHRSKNGKDEDE